MILNQGNLNSISKRIAVPAYNRNNLKPGIVHIGVGGFHRAHQACYTDELMSKQDADEWGICGIGIREADRSMWQALSEQDFLYTVVEKSPDGGSNPRVVGSIIDYILAPDAPEKAIIKLASSTTKIVSLTITEGGYNLSDSSGEFDFSNSDVQWDLHHPEEPRTVFGYLAAALNKRKAAGFPGFTILSCDNIQTNGDIARKMFLTFIKEQDRDLVGWVEKNVRFPNSMVDRITPVTTPDDIEELKTKFNIEDNWPVVCESFTQWIIEDNFVNGRPEWEKAGAQFVSNVEPYEMMKLRLLNAGHSLLGIIGTLLGYTSIDEAVKDPILEKMLCQFFNEEVSPTLGQVEGIDLDAYKEKLIERFGNPNIKDKLSRICSESSAKLPKFLLPTIKSQIETNGQIKISAAIVASWYRYLELDGKNDDGQRYEIIDEKYDLLQKAISNTDKDNPVAFLKIESLFGEIGNSDRFLNHYLAAVDELRKRGPRPLIADVIQNTNRR
ncbi:mannitol dehydrogenase family protein [Rhodohalobacter sp. 614A]|uniref:mannitol dehydrogenase family protein n=1 Tax=Rhodohalobacter sp. 614A TaxID=2908649 RepID=UPI001F30FC6B|nr:mannitol dehydrogenase family protein [Rhodohalobacter sp. 614A]